MDYKSTGVDIDSSNSLKTDFRTMLGTADSRVLNQVGAFASLYDFATLQIKDPVIVTKTEEPGSKQLLAFELDMYESICFDMINHLVNDCIMCGSHPLIVQDCIVCGKLENDKVKRMVRAMREACTGNNCILVGGETSVQPGVIPEGTYILSSSIVGVVERANIIDGSKIREGDNVLAIESSGPHTNGYTLIREVMKIFPQIKQDIKFMSAIMAPHRPYYNVLRNYYSNIRGMAHITGGGIAENLDRVIPSGLCADIDLSKIQILEVFKTIKSIGDVPYADMLRTFNLGVGVALVVNPDLTDFLIEKLSYFFKTYKIGGIVKGDRPVTFHNELNW